MLAIGFCFCLSACASENKKYDLTEIEQEEYNHDLFVGFCVMPMEHTENSFVAKRSYQEEGYFSPKAFKNSDIEA